VLALRAALRGQAVYLVYEDDGRRVRARHLEQHAHLRGEWARGGAGQRR
jgi:hypothetical protein